MTSDGGSAHKEAVSMNIKKLEYFCAIVSNRQISRAAQKLHISQPPLSQRLKELEDEFGVKLIDRKGRKFEVTAEGQELYQRAQFLLSYYEGMKEDIRNMAGSFSGLLRMGVEPAFEGYFLRSVLPMLNKHPQMRFRIWIMDNQSQERQLQERKLDIGLLQLPLQKDNYEILPLPAQEYVALFGGGMRAPDKPEVGIEDLADMPLVLLKRRDTGGSYDRIMTEFQQRSLNANIVMDSQDAGFIINLLRTGYPAVGIVPGSASGFEHDAGGLVLRKIAIEGLHFSPVLAHIKGVYLGRASQLLREILAEEAD